jgi:zinc transport system ATP-binding protein
MTMDGAVIVSFEGVSFRYNDDTILEDVNLKIHDGEFAWIVGPNGGGKTTLVKLMLGLLHPNRGRVSVFGGTPERARHRVGYMAQQVNVDPRFPIDVLGVTLMGREGAGRRFGRYSRDDRRAAMKALEQVGLSERAESRFSELSGGQMRRLLIARALAGEPDLLILDEPMANLDPAVQRSLYELLDYLNQRLTVVMVSHDPAFVAGSIERAICVNRKVQVHPTSEMTEDVLADLYGEGAMRFVQHGHDFHRSRRGNSNG